MEINKCNCFLNKLRLCKGKCIILCNKCVRLRADAKLEEIVQCLICYSDNSLTFGIYSSRSIVNLDIGHSNLCGVLCTVGWVIIFAMGFRIHRNSANFKFISCLLRNLGCLCDNNILTSSDSLG